MIAQVRVSQGEENYTVTLDDAGRWISPEFPEVADSLNSLHASTFPEWNGNIGAWQANDAAEKLHGEIVYLRS